MTGPTTLSICLDKPLFSEARKACDGMSQDVLRLKNQTIWLCKIALDHHEGKVQALVTDEGNGNPRVPTDFEKRRLADLKLLSSCMREFNAGREGNSRQPAFKDRKFRGLTPVFLKWLFASSCKKFRDKAHFKALPSRVGQNSIRRSATPSPIGPP